MQDQGSEVLDLERRFWLEGAGHPAFWQEHFAHDGVVVLEIGLLDKTDTVAAMEHARPWASVEMEDVRELTVGQDHVALAYRACGRREGDDAPYEAAVTSVYAHRPSGWMLLLHQQTPARSA